MAQSKKGAVLITGTSSGLGRAAALTLDKQGYRVFAGVRTEKDAESLKHDASGNLTPIILDITKAEQIQSALDFVSLATDDEGLFALVNNAVAVVHGPLECVPIEDVRWLFEVNVTGYIAVTQAFLPLLRKAKGRIINISAVGGRVATPYFGHLSASKFALESLTDCWRMELRSSQIEVLSILAGSFNTEVHEKVEASYQKTLANMSPEAKAIYGKNQRIHKELTIEGNRNGMPSEKVVEAILEALEARKPKRQYFVTPSKWETRLLFLYKRLFSHEHFYEKFYGLLQKNMGWD